MKLKQYYNTAKIPGLPDTTNISDPQLRLFLDRIKVFCSEIALTVDGFQRYSNIENIAKDLVENNFFNEAIGKTITQKVDPIVDDKIKSSVDKINNSDIKLQNIGVNPRVLTINTFIEGTAYLVEEYIPSDTANKYKGIYWSSSDENVATVDQSGVVTAVAVGECEIVLTSKYDSDISTVAKVKITNYQTVTVYADISWCTGDHSSVVFTEDAVPGNGACIWENRENIVTLHPDMSEKEAELLAALTSVASSETRKFITCDNHTGTFWRDDSKDIILSYTGKTVYGLAVLGTPITQQTGLFVENTAAYGQTDSGRVFSSAYTGSGVTDDIVKDYLADKLQIAENIPLKTPADYGVRYMLGYDNQQGYAVKTGRSVQLRDYPPDMDMGEDLNTYTTIYEWRTYDNSATFWLSDTASGRRIGAYPSAPYWSYDSDYGYVIKPDTTVEVSSRLHGYCFELDGILYFALTSYNQGTEGLVFSADCKEAWSLSPCYQDDDKLITVYTDTENPSAGAEYTVLTSDSMLAAGLVTATGEGIYSITGANGTTYYPHE